MVALPVNEIFHSIQGEGSFTGTPAIFIRLQYCGVGCGYCDTKHTWELNSIDEITIHDMLLKEKDAQTWATCDTKYLIEYLIRQPEKLIVLTGGEPCTYDLTDLTSKLLEFGKQPQIETSGTSEIKAHEHTFITVSPKIDMPGGKKVLVSALYRADEIKMPVGKIADIVKLKELLSVHKSFASDPPEVFLQPLSQSEKATELCIERARQNGWRLSAQLHKYLKIR